MPFGNGLRDFLDFTCSNARRADAQPPAGAVHQRADRLQVEIPTPLGHVVGMTDAVAELGAAATDFTYFRHKTEFSRCYRNDDYIKARRLAATAHILASGLL
jgi:hypothetical protein